MSQENESADIGLIGLAVMGQNLVLNMADHGFKIAVFNRTVSKVHDFINGSAAGKSIVGADSMEFFVALLKRPRKIFLLVQAGQAVDNMISSLIPHLLPGDVIIDGGNSLYTDSIRRFEELTKQGFLFIGTGVSGGEEGARYGPSLMPGGSPEAWHLVKDILQSIAAKVDDKPCCEWVGTSGSGHFVKMVHNGIEYGDMQLICEVFHIMKNIMNLDYKQMSETFEAYNKTELDSYLIEITAKVLKYKDTDGEYLVSKIRDKAGQKGTGKWTIMASMELGVPVTLISESVYARCLSAMIEERAVAADLTPLETDRKLPFTGDYEEMSVHVRRALLAAKIISYAQGFMLLKSAANEYSWDLNFAEIAMMWRGGCIIRSVLLNHIKDAFVKDANLSCLLLDQYFVEEMRKCINALRFVVATAISQCVPVPCLSSALAFYDGYRSKWLPASLLQ
ncbi:hypothetical protein GJ496_000881, partial [Pomphorhynchus laevis]